MTEMHKCKEWTAEELEYLKNNYADASNKELAGHLGRTVKSVAMMSVRMGLRKSRQYMEGLYKSRAQNTAIAPFRFKKGHMPFNKGKKLWQYMNGESLERVRMRFFKKGHRPFNTHPIGYESKDRKGNVYVKTAYGEPMRLKHVVVWEKANGREVPKGMIVAFSDGDRQNFSPDNLVLMTRSELVKLKFKMMDPEERKEYFSRSNAARNELICKDKMRIRWGLEPRTKLVKKWYPREVRV